MTQQIEATISINVLEANGTNISEKYDGTELIDTMTALTDENVLVSMLKFYIKLGFNNNSVIFTSGDLTLTYTPPLERNGNGSYEIHIIDNSNKKEQIDTISIGTWGDY